MFIKGIERETSTLDGENVNCAICIKVMEVKVMCFYRLFKSLAVKQSSCKELGVKAVTGNSSAEAIFILTDD